MSFTPFGHTTIFVHVNGNVKQLNSFIKNEITLTHTNIHTVHLFTLTYISYTCLIFRSRFHLKTSVYTMFVIAIALIKMRVKVEYTNSCESITPLYFE